MDTPSKTALVKQWRQFSIIFVKSKHILLIMDFSLLFSIIIMYLCYYATLTILVNNHFRYLRKKNYFWLIFRTNFIIPAKYWLLTYDGFKYSLICFFIYFKHSGVIFKIIFFILKKSQQLNKNNICLLEKLLLLATVAMFTNSHKS